MSNIVKIEFKRTSSPGYPIIRKEVDGEIIECVNIDELTPLQRKAWERDQAKLSEPEKEE